MPRLRIAATLSALIALAVAPAAAHAAVTGSQITSWTSNQPATSNNPYLISFDNPPVGPTTLTVKGTAAGTGSVDIVCYSGSTPTVTRIAASVAVQGNGTFNSGAVPLKPIAGSVCRLRAVPAGSDGAGNDVSNFAGPTLAVSEAALPVATIGGALLNHGTPYNVYVNDVTFTGTAAWASPGVTPSTSAVGCGGPFAAPIDSVGNVGDYAIDCTGSLLSNDLGAFGGRSEVQVDGRNAYDPASAQALFAAAGGHAASQNLSGFPTDLTGNVTWDPTTGLLTSTSDESWVICNGPNMQVQSFATCPNFVNSGVKLQRTTTTSDGGRVVTLTDTWSSTDGQAHSLDLLYDDFVGVLALDSGNAGYEFPGQSSFSQSSPGTDVPGPSNVPGSILVRTNVTKPDGDPSEAAGAITFGKAPSEFRFPSNNEFEEHNLVLVPAGGSASLSYIYSVGYSVADVSALALAAQDRFEPPSVVIGSPASGTAVSSPTVTVSGTADAGSGINSIVVGGQTVPVASNGGWTAQVPLSPGTNTITALATDGAGATAQAQVAVVYNAPAPPPAPPAPPAPVKCKVPRTKGMKLAAAERAVRAAHCKVGKVKHVASKKVRSGRIMSTSPSAGRILKVGTKIEFFVSKGR
jgi:hypothetical protein